MEVDRKTNKDRKLVARREIAMQKLKYCGGKGEDVYGGKANEKKR